MEGSKSRRQSVEGSDGFELRGEVLTSGDRLSRARIGGLDCPKPSAPNPSVSEITN